jgi:hypothetical protein
MYAITNQALNLLFVTWRVSKTCQHSFNKSRLVSGWRCGLMTLRFVHLGPKTSPISNYVTRSEEQFVFRLRPLPLNFLTNLK